MELQLGLAIAGFDLNRYGYEPKAVFGCYKKQEKENKKKKKRFLNEAFDENMDDDRHVPHTLPLLAWNSKDREEDDDDDNQRDDQEENSFFINKSRDGDESSVIGWPPINSWRKKHCYENCSHNRTVENQCGRGLNSSYVKVKMEGVGIGRKVDLSVFHSYQTLTKTLIAMFGKCQENVKAYKLTYQDKEGDWLLAGDIPWSTFTRSVQRLKLLKNGG
ncbi:hypothetical protein LguiA_018671 [Lonicera macranthoides]